LVIDDLQDVAAPLTALKLAEAGATVRLLTRWPMIAGFAGGLLVHELGSITTNQAATSRP
jgi:hypothetical protein